VLLDPAFSVGTEGAVSLCIGSGAAPGKVCAEVAGLGRTLIVGRIVRAGRIYIGLVIALAGIVMGVFGIGNALSQSAPEALGNGVIWFVIAAAIIVLGARVAGLRRGSSG
jgi:hypothetical protein